MFYFCSIGFGALMASHTLIPARHPAAETVDADLRRGRGAVSNTSGRFEPTRRETFDDGWESLSELAAFKTEVREDTARGIITRNDMGACIATPGRRMPIWGILLVSILRLSFT
jgi:hypothetical protein